MPCNFKPQLYAIQILNIKEKGEAPLETLGGENGGEQKRCEMHVPQLFPHIAVKTKR